MIQKWLKDNEYNILMMESNPYGEYYRAEKYYGKYGHKIELNIYDMVKQDRIHIKIIGGHYEGHINGYVDKINDIENVITFITNQRNR